MKDRTSRLIDAFFDRHPELIEMRTEMLKACGSLLCAFQAGGKLLLCGNGGSCADCDHIVGELMKGFHLRRPIPDPIRAELEARYGESGKALGMSLQGGLPAISLCNHAALSTAFANDADGEMVYAQQLTGYGRRGDVLMGISTSGNAANILHAFRLARVLGIITISLTGGDGGGIAGLSDICLIAPERETYLVQECHLAMYHLICAYLESEMFAE